MAKVIGIDGEKVIRLTIPGKPTAKKRPRHRVYKSGKQVTYTPRETVSTENLIALSFRQEHPGFELLQGALSLVVIAYMPIPKSWSQRNKDKALLEELFPTTKPEADNILKLVADALEGIVYHCDSQIVDCRLMKLYGERPRLEIELSKITGNVKSVSGSNMG